jgi:redox-sensitive bicupin YhaK (pirin superfamily)
MITIRKSSERGQADHGWLQSAHTFSFADYYDADHMGFRAIRVINEDHIAPGEGFGTHPHADMEILTYMISGSLAHKDSMGNGREIKAGELQAMTAGRGITHSEFNASKELPAHLLQIWIIPNQKGLTPSYAEWKPAASSAPKILLASNDGRDGSVLIHQDVSLYLGSLKAGEELSHAAPAERYFWLQLISGEINCSGEKLYAGDAAAVSAGQKITVKASQEAKFLLFDLA